MKALSHALTKFPKLNAHLDTTNNESHPQLTLKGSYNFGIAVDTKHGLLVSVVKDVQKHSIMSLAAEIKRLSKLAHLNRLGLGDIGGATFTASNIGSIGGCTLSPVIVRPMVAILGIGKVAEVPMLRMDVHGDEWIEKGEKVDLSWSADRRVLDGCNCFSTCRTPGLQVR